MDFRRQDLYRARDRANDALTIFKGADDKLKIAELQNHLAMIELADGKPEAALAAAEEAEGSADVAVVKANAEYVRGLVAKRDRGTIENAIEHFKKSRRCFVCSEQTGGIFNKAKAIAEKIDKLKAAEEAAAADELTDEQIFSEYEASKAKQQKRAVNTGWAIV